MIAPTAQTRLERLVDRAVHEARLDVSEILAIVDRSAKAEALSPDDPAVIELRDEAERLAWAAVAERSVSFA